MLDAIKERLLDGRLISRRHPQLPLTIYNYSRFTQYEQLWDEYTLMCRGLVLDDKGNIVARGFPKFFNWEEKRYTPTDEMTIFEKLDGYLILVFRYKDQIIVTSRGSFDSAYSRRAERLFDGNFEFVADGFTYIFELLLKEDKIIVKYSEDELVHIGTYQTQTGQYVPGQVQGFRTPKTEYYKGDAEAKLRELKERNLHNEEGYVVRFSNDSLVKIKFAGYVAIHKVMMRFSPRRILQQITENTIIKYMELVPDELYSETLMEIGKFYLAFRKLKNEMEAEYLQCLEIVNKDGTYKEWYEASKEFKYTHLLMSKVRGYDLDQALWKEVAKILKDGMDN